MTQAIEGKFIRYTTEGHEIVHVSYNSGNLNDTRRKVGGNYDVVEGWGVHNANGTIDFYGRVEDIPTSTPTKKTKKTKKATYDDGYENKEPEETETDFGVGGEDTGNSEGL